MDRDVAKFNGLKEEIQKDFGGWVEENSQRAHEYAVLTLRSLLLVSGGGLLAIPALAGISENFRPEIGIWASLCFAASVLFCILCSYFAHLNWSSAHLVSIETRNHYLGLAWEASGGNSADQVSFKAHTARLQKRATLTFRLAHIFGIGGVVFFAGGIALLFFAFDFGRTVGGEL